MEYQNLQTGSSVCPVCYSRDLSDIVEIQRMPILVNVLWTNRQDALNVKRGDFCLSFCKQCGHVFNRFFNPAQVDYNVPYENSLHFSSKFQSYASWFANYIVKKYDLHGKIIIEIGSGKGEFLQMLCDLGGNVGTGFDPSYQPMPGEKSSTISFVKDIYSEQYADYQADLIISRHVLEHIYEPLSFLKRIRKTIGDNKRTVVIFEVPNLAYILEETAIWDLIYEHFSYFGPQSLSSLFHNSSFNILNLSQTFDNQFLVIEAIPRKENSRPPNSVHAFSVSVLAKQIDDFSLASQKKISRWKKSITNMASQGKRIVLWGAGSKGISFLNMLSLNDEIEYIVDINPRKRGMFVTGTGQKIISPEFLREYRPEIVIIMNPIYTEEIGSNIRHLGIDPSIIAAT